MIGRANLFIGIVAAATASSSQAFQYQHDTADDCVERWQQKKCTTDDTTWFECPVTCNQDVYHVGGISEKKDNWGDIFDLTVTKADGSEMELEQLEGYVSIYAVLPLIRGYAQFYYELLEHIQSLFPYTIEILVQPYRTENEPDLQLKLHETSKLIILEETTRPTMLLDYMETFQEVAGTPDMETRFDRVSIFLLATDGRFMERLVSPHVHELEKRLMAFLKQLNWRPGAEL